MHHVQEKKAVGLLFTLHMKARYHPHNVSQITGARENVFGTITEIIKYTWMTQDIAALLQIVIRF
jgi:hypothetical protein